MGFGHSAGGLIWPEHLKQRREEKSKKRAQSQPSQTTSHLLPPPLPPLFYRGASSALANTSSLWVTLRRASPWFLLQTLQCIFFSTSTPKHLEILPFRRRQWPNVVLRSADDLVVWLCPKTCFPGWWTMIGSSFTEHTPTSLLTSHTMHAQNVSATRPQPN